MCALWGALLPRACFFPSRQPSGPGGCAIWTRKYSDEDDNTQALNFRLSMVKVEMKMQKREEGLQSRGLRQPQSSALANDAGIISTIEISKTLMHRWYRVVCELTHRKPHVKFFVAEPCPDAHTTTTHQSSTDNLVLLKHRSCSSLAELQDAMRELSILKLVTHLHPCSTIVPVLSYIAQDTRVVIVMPYLEGGDLCGIISEGESPLAEDNARRCFSDIIQALLHLKRYGIAHGDVSLENVMLTSRNMQDGHPRAVLIDMGSACLVDAAGSPLSMFSYRGKLGYVSPEVVFLRKSASATSLLQHGKIDPFAIDVWAAACCLYPMLTGRPLFRHPSDVAFQRLTEKDGALLLITHYYEKFNLEVTHQARNLLCAMLSPDPAARPILEEILAHPWLSSAPTPVAIRSSASTAEAAATASICC